MKNYLKLTAVIGLILFTTTSMANEPTIDLENGKDGKSIVLTLDAQSANAKIRLTDADGNVLFYDNNVGQILKKKFNLDNLEKGIYSFKVDSERATSVYNVTVGENAVSIEKDTEVKSKPIARQEEKKVYLNFLNRGLAPVEICILDKNGNIVFKESRESDLIVKGIYNLHKASKGDYTLMVKYGNESFFKNIEIN